MNIKAQCGLNQREHGASAGALSCAAALLTVLSLAILCAPAASAAEHPVHLHTAQAAQHPRNTQADAARSHATLYKASPNRSANSGNRAKAAAQIAAHRREAAAAHPTNLRRRRSMHHTKSTAGQAAQMPPATAEARPQAASPQAHPLTVDDFLHAAHDSSTNHTSGPSRPHSELSTAPTHSASPQPVHLSTSARVEAAEPAQAPGATQRASASDLAGAPLTSGEHGSERASRAASDAPSPAFRASRQELTAEVEQPMVLPGLYRNGRLVVPRPLKGSREILVHQNLVADDEGLNRIQDSDDMQRMRSAHLLVDLPESSSLHLNPELTGDRRCARPWTVHFAADISRSFYARFHQPLQVNSAARTVAYQMRLQRVNGNAAGTDGEVASPHLTGQAIDFGKRGMSTAEIAWMRLYLLPLMQSGDVDVEEEFQQACFHISVYRRYETSTAMRRRAPARTEVAQLHDGPRVSKTASRSNLDR